MSLNSSSGKVLLFGFHIPTVPHANRKRNLTKYNALLETLSEFEGCVNEFRRLRYSELIFSGLAGLLVPVSVFSAIRSSFDWNETWKVLVDLSVAAPFISILLTFITFILISRHRSRKSRYGDRIRDRLTDRYMDFKDLRDNDQFDIECMKRACVKANVEYGRVSLPAFCDDVGLDIRFMILTLVAIGICLVSAVLPFIYQVLAL